MRFDLNSRSLAEYHWGTLFCRFSPAAPVERRTFFTILSALAAGAAPWHSEHEFRACAALLHELVHLAQDLATGIGHADFVTQRTQSSNLLHYAPLVLDLDGPSARPPYRRAGEAPWFEEKEDPIVEAAHEQLRYYPFAMMPPARREYLRTHMAADLGHPVDDEALFDLSTQAILESDAALRVLLTMRALGMTEPQREVLRANLGLLDAKKLGPEYWGAHAHLNSVLRHHCAFGDDEVENVLSVIFGLLVDSALACPPLDWIDARGEEHNQYEPGLEVHAFASRLPTTRRCAHGSVLGSGRGKALRGCRGSAPRAIPFPLSFVVRGLPSLV